MIIYYNPGCSKCNEALDLLHKNSCEVQIREYLKLPPTIKELEALLKQLGCSPNDIIRKNEPLFIEKFSGQNFGDEDWIKILTENPILIERPIVIDGEKAIIGRPPMRVLDLIKKKAE